MITVFSLIKRRPKAHVSPSKNSSAMAPRAHDLRELDKNRKIRAHLRVVFNRKTDWGYLITSTNFMLSRRLESGLSAEELRIILWSVIMRKMRLSYNT